MSTQAAEQAQVTNAKAHALVLRYRDALEAIEDLRAITRSGRQGATTEQPEYRALADEREAAYAALINALLRPTSLPLSSTPEQGLR